MTNLMDTVAEVAPEHYQYFEKTAHEIRQSPWCDEIVQEMNHIIKTAEEMANKMAFDIGGMARGFGQAAKSMAGHPLPVMIGSTIAGGIALNLAGDLYEAARRGLTKSRNWSSMLKANPDLAMQAKSDPSVKTMFDTLHRFNPEFSADPHVAANFVKAQLEYPTDIGIIKDLVKSRSDVRNATGLRPMPGIPVKTPADLKEQELRMQGQQGQMDSQKMQMEKNRLEMQRMEMEMENAPDLAAQEAAYRAAQMENQRWQARANQQKVMEGAQDRAQSNQSAYERRKR